MHPASPRIAPLHPSQFTDEQAEVSGGRGNARGDLNIVRLLVQHPALFRNWIPFAMHTIGANTLAAREREIVILHTCSACGGKYDVAQHRVIASRAGLSQSDIEAAIADGSGLAEAERVLIRAVDELLVQRCIADATYAQLSARLSTQQLLDLVFTVGNYTLMSMTTATFGVQIEADVESGWKP